MTGYQLESSSQNINNPAVTEQQDASVLAAIAGTIVFLMVTFIVGGIAGSRRQRVALKFARSIAKKVL